MSIDRTADMDRLEPVAIVGMSFGFPGEANTSQSLWDMMMSKKNASREFPKDRLDVDGLYHPDPNRRGQVILSSRAHGRGRVAFTGTDAHKWSRCPSVGVIS